MIITRDAEGITSYAIDRAKVIQEQQYLREIAVGIADNITEFVGKGPTSSRYYDAFNFLWKAVHDEAEEPETHTLCTNKREKFTRRAVSHARRLTVYERDSFTCVLCGVPGGDLTIDHIVPVSKGGSNDLDNLQTACRSCNISKGAKL